MDAKLLPTLWATLLVVFLTLTALSCADYPEGAQDPNRAIQPDMTFQAAEDEVLTIAADAGVLAQIEEADPLTWSVASTGTLTTTGPLDCEECAKGRVEMEADGSFSYTPAADFEGYDYLYISVASDTGGEGEYIVLFDVAGSNDPPGAEDDAVATDEDTAVTITPLENDADIDLNDSIAIISVGDVGHGSVTADLQSGAITYTPAANFFGEDGFTYVIADLAGEESTASVTITVAAVNDAPTATADSFGTDEDQALSVDAASGVLANDTDIDDAAADLTATAGTLASAGGGSVALQADGAFTYTPADNFFGEDSFTYELKDPAGASAQGTVTLTVTEVNDAPTAVSDSYGAQEDAGLTIAADQGLLINDSDIDNDPLTVVTGTVATAQGGSATLAADGGFSYTPAGNFFGSDNFEYTVSDGRGGLTPATVTLDVAGVEDPPVAEDDAASVNEGGEVNIDVLANDSDPDVSGTEGLTIVQADHGTNGRVVINNGKSVTYTPNDDFEGTDSFTYIISDGELQDTATVTVTVANVNDPPTAVDDPAETEEESPVTINVTANDTDPDPGELLTIQSVDTAGANGTVAISPNNRSLTYTPDVDFVGTDTFTYVVTDREGATDEGTVTVTVTNVAPVANDDSLGNIISWGGSVSGKVLENDTDGQTLIPFNETTGTRVNQVGYQGASYDVPADLSNPRRFDVTCGNISVSANGEITVYRTSISCPVSSDSLTYTIVDSAGVSAPSAATVSWGFSNIIITLSAPPTNQTDEDQALSVSSANGVLAEAGSAWSVSTTTAMETLFGGSATVNAYGAFSYTPPPNFSGTDSFGFSAEAVGDDPPASGRALVTVDPVDDAPLAQADIYTLGGGSLVVTASQGLLHNDVDLEGDGLTVTSVDNGALSGTLDWQTNGAFTYTGAPSANESFTYTVSDGSRTSTASVTLVVGATAPFAAAVNSVTQEDAALSANVNNSGGATASAGGTSRFGGSVSMGAGGNFTYTPPPNFTGIDSFTYQLTGGSFTANGLVQITVDAVDDAPLAGDDFYTIGQDTPFTTAAAGGVLANDIDPDGDDLTVTTTGVQTTDQGGEVEIFADGHITYGPPAGFTGTDRFDYTVEDGTGNGAAATVIVNVTF